MPLPPYAGPAVNNLSRRLAGGFVLGTALGLTPLFNLHNLAVLAVLLIVRVSCRGFFLGWLVAIPVGFLLDPAFDALGASLLASPVLRPLWLAASSAPLVSLTSFNNTVTLGSVVFWVTAWIPTYLVMTKLFGLYGELVERTISGLPWPGRINQSRLVRLFAGTGAGTGWVRKSFVMPLGALFFLSVASWWLLADRGARLAVERGGTAAIGATVDLAFADLDLTGGTVTLTGLEVTDPAAPQKNMVEVGTISMSISMAALLSSRISIDSVVVRDLRFNTLRSVPGKVDTLRERSTFFRDQMASWRASAVVPGIAIPDLSGLVDLNALHADSLATVIRARQVASAVEATGSAIGASLTSMNLGDQIDSARSMLARLEGVSMLSLGVARTVRTVASVGSMIARIESSISGVAALRSEYTAGLATLRSDLSDLSALRAEDYALARRALNLPSFTPDDLSASVLQAPLMQRVETLLYWINRIDEYLSREKEPLQFPGPLRFRAAGDDIIFRSRKSQPFFSLRRLHGSVVLGSVSGFSVGVFDLSTNPALTARPAIFRLTGSNGTSEANVEIELDRTSATPNDGFRARLLNLPLPTLEIPMLAARLNLGDGTTTVALTRIGDSISGVVTWSTMSASWERDDPADSPLGTELIWETLSQLTSVEITMRLSGSLASPVLNVSSNIGSQVAGVMRARVANELELAEHRVREEVNRLIEEPLLDAHRSLAVLEDGVGQALGGYEQQLEQLKSHLETLLRQLRPGIPGIGR